MISELKLVACDSKSELQEHLRRATRSLLVGRDAESPRSFYTVEVPGTKPLLIGLNLSRHKPLPAVLAAQNCERLLIGHDQSLTWVNVTSGRVTATQPLEGVFYEFVQSTDTDTVVIHELGALKVRFDGAVSWTVLTSDIVESFHVRNAGVLELKVVDSNAPVRVGLADGREIGN